MRMPETGLRACFENSGCGWLGGGAVAGEAAGHDDDHGPVDVGLMVGGQAFVVADVWRWRVIQASVRSTTQRRGSTWKVCRSSGRLTICSVSFGLSLAAVQVTSFPA